MPDLFHMEPQQKDQWCWAAVTLSVERYYSPRSQLTQCAIARGVLGFSCCSNPDRCNHPAKLQDALSGIGRLIGEPTSGPMSFTHIRQRLDEGRPICLRIGWHGGGGHFVIICGYGLSRSGVELVDVEDPLFGPATVTYDEFISNYRSSGRWTFTYPV
jgi:hypothetical protein